jgi:hypothetical protein
MGLENLVFRNTPIDAFEFVHQTFGQVSNQVVNAVVPAKKSRVLLPIDQKFQDQALA